MCPGNVAESWRRRIGYAFKGGYRREMFDGDLGGGCLRVDAEESCRRGMYTRKVAGGCMRGMQMAGVRSGTCMGGVQT